MSTNEADALMKKQATDELIGELAALVTKYGGKVPIGNIVGAMEATKFRLLWDYNKRFEDHLHNSGN